LKNKQVKDVIDAIFGVAVQQIKNGNFRLAGMLILKLTKKHTILVRKGIKPFTKKPCIFKAKPASNS